MRAILIENSVFNSMVNILGCWKEYDIATNVGFHTIS